MPSSRRSRRSRRRGAHARRGCAPAPNRSLWAAGRAWPRMRCAHPAWGNWGSRLPAASAARLPAGCCRMRTREFPLITHGLGCACRAHASPRAQGVCGGARCLSTRSYLTRRQGWAHLSIERSRFRSPTCPNTPSRRPLPSGRWRRLFETLRPDGRTVSAISWRGRGGGTRAHARWSQG